MILTPWDPARPAGRFDPLSEYLEVAWLPLIGPSATFMYRRLVMFTPGEVDLRELGLMLGLGSGIGTASRTVRTLERLAQYRLVRPDPAPVTAPRLSVRTTLPTLTRRQLERLAPAVARRAIDTEEALR